jgi:hypothetical protein
MGCQVDSGGELHIELTAGTLVSSASQPVLAPHNRWPPHDYAMLRSMDRMSLSPLFGPPSCTFGAENRSVNMVELLGKCLPGREVPDRPRPDTA